MPRVHPKKNIAPELITASHVKQKANDMAHKFQASQTFILDSRDNGVPLGLGGEQRAFGKPQVSFKPGLDLSTNMKVSNWATASSLLFHEQEKMMNDASIGKDRGLLTRAVAAYQLDSMLGLNSIAEEKFGRMKDGQLMGISVQASGKGVYAIENNENTVLDIDYSDPRIQRGLSDLEISDYITGQTDRHLGNVFVDPTTGKVTGIDNDLCFPEISRVDLMKDNEVASKSIVGMPKRMHEETAQRLLNTDPQALEDMLRRTRTKGAQPLSEEAITGAANRLRELQAELGKGQGSSIRVVKQFDQQTYQDALDEADLSYKAECGMTMPEAIVKFQGNGNTVPLGDIRRCKKTSLLAKVATEQTLAHEQPQNNVFVTQAPPMNKVASKDMAEGRAYKAMPPAEQKEFDKEFAKLARKEKQLASKEEHLKKLDHPGFLDKLRSIPEGGVKKARVHDQRDVDRLKNEIAALNQSLDNRLAPYLPTQQVTQTAPQVNQNNSQGITDQGQGNTLKESKGKEIDHGDDSELDLEASRTLSPGEGSSGTQPELVKQGSVRELMKGTGNVRAMKEKLAAKGLDLGKNVPQQGQKNAPPKVPIRGTK